LPGRLKSPITRDALKGVPYVQHCAGRPEGPPLRTPYQLASV